MGDEITIERLAEQIAARNEDALALLYERLAPSLRGMLLRILPAADAEDVLEKVFVEFWKRAGQGRGCRASPETWLALAARKVAVQRLRLTRKLPALERTRAGIPSLREPWLPNFQEASLLASRQELLQRSLNHLPAPQRKVLDLVLFQGYTEEEMATILNEPLGRVRDEVRAALSFTRQRLHTLMGSWTADI